MIRAQSQIYITDARTNLFHQKSPIKMSTRRILYIVSTLTECIKVLKQLFLSGHFYIISGALKAKIFHGHMQTRKIKMLGRFFFCFLAQCSDTDPEIDQLLLFFLIHFIFLDDVY